MTTSARILLRVTLDDGTVERNEVESVQSISDVVGANGRRETIALAAAFNALSPPTGATLVVISWVSGTGTWTLKGVTGDTGIALGTPSATTQPIVVTLSSASIGITASGSGSAEVLWL